MKFNNNFLEEVGLENLSNEDKDSLLNYIYSELELRVGEELSSNMTYEQVDEFKKIIKKDTRFMLSWLSAFVPMYQSDDMFVNIQESNDYDIADPRLLEEYVSAKWLELNCPDYAQIVAHQISEIKKEIVDNKDKIISA